MSNERVHVAVGVIFNSTKDKVLISKRFGEQHLAGCWEFPGGKVKKNETVQSALTRELYEELGITIEKAEWLKLIHYDYKEKSVCLDVWRIDKWHGEARGKEDQEIVWAPVNELDQYKFPEANEQIIGVITLPPVYLISKEEINDHANFLSVLEQCFQSGLKIFQLRLKKDRQEDRLFNLLKDIKTLTDKYSVKLILNGSSHDVKKFKVDGVHLNSHQLHTQIERVLDKKYILGASCHNERDIQQANRINSDYIFLSPVHKTNSCPERETIGWEKFSQLAKGTDIPIYALGGIKVNELKVARNNGAHGIAMISSIWNTEKPSTFIEKIVG